MKQMELVERKRADAEKIKKQKIKLSLSVAIIGILMIVIGFIGGSVSGDSDSPLYSVALVGFPLLMGAAGIWGSSKEKDDDDIDYVDKATVPLSISNYEKKNYNAIEAMFKSAGFTSVQSVALNDLTVGLLKKPGMVESITINGQSVFQGGKKYPKDAPVIISYHSLNR